MTWPPARRCMWWSPAVARRPLAGRHRHRHAAAQARLCQRHCRPAGDQGERARHPGSRRRLGPGKTGHRRAGAAGCAIDGARVRVFKTGPDFLDPLTLARASGAEVVDNWIYGWWAEAGCRQRLAAAAQDADWILVGSRDGLVRRRTLVRRPQIALACRCWRCWTRAPWRKPAGALALGLRDATVRCSLAGVLANRVAGDSHAAMVAESLRDIPLLGHLPRQAQSLPRRHLAWSLPDELADFDVRLDALQPGAAGRRRLAGAAPPDPAARAGPGAAAAAGRPPAGAGARCRVCLCLPGQSGLPARAGRGAGWNFRHWPTSPSRPGGRAVSARRLPGCTPKHSAAPAPGKPACAPHAAGLPIWAECGGMMALADAIDKWTATAGAWPACCRRGAYARPAGRPGQASLGRAARAYVSLFAAGAAARAAGAHRQPARRRARRAIYQVEQFAGPVIFMPTFRPPRAGGVLVLPAEDRPILSGLPAWLLALCLLAGVALDAWWGEPRRWHPLVGFGWLAQRLETQLNRGGAAAVARRAGSWALLVAPPLALAACSWPPCRQPSGWALAAGLHARWRCTPRWACRSLAEHPDRLPARWPPAGWTKRASAPAGLSAATPPMPARTRTGQGHR